MCQWQVLDRETAIFIPCEKAASEIWPDGLPQELFVVLLPDSNSQNGENHA